MVRERTRCPWHSIPFAQRTVRTIAGAVGHTDGTMGKSCHRIVRLSRSVLQLERFTGVDKACPGRFDSNRHRGARGQRRPRRSQPNMPINATYHLPPSRRSSNSGIGLPARPRRSDAIPEHSPTLPPRSSVSDRPKPSLPSVHELFGANQTKCGSAQWPRQSSRQPPQFDDGTERVPPGCISRWSTCQTSTILISSPLPLLH